MSGHGDAPTHRLLLGGAVPRLSRENTLALTFAGHSTQGLHRQCVAALRWALARQPGLSPETLVTLRVSRAVLLRREQEERSVRQERTVRQERRESLWYPSLLAHGPWRHLTGKSWLLRSRRGCPTARELSTRTVYAESARSDRFGAFWSTIMSMGSANASFAVLFVPSM